jgi:hypothetical protein
MIQAVSPVSIAFSAKAGAAAKSILPIVNKIKRSLEESIVTPYL